MNDYLNKKVIDEDRSNSNVRRKSLATEAGHAMAFDGKQFVSTNNDDAAYVNILFIPSLLALIYLIGLVIYNFVIK